MSTFIIHVHPTDFHCGPSITWTRQTLDNHHIENSTSDFHMTLETNKYTGHSTTQCPYMIICMNERNGVQHVVHFTTLQEAKTALVKLYSECNHGDLPLEREYLPNIKYKHYINSLEPLLPSDFKISNMCIFALLYCHRTDSILDSCFLAPTQ